MVPFLEHAEKCEKCRTKQPCRVGYDLFERGTERLTRGYDPKRAKA